MGDGELTGRRQVISTLVADWARIRTVTIETARAFPGERLDVRPVAAMRSAGQILAHILDTELAVVDGALTGDWRFGRGPHRISRVETFERWSAKVRAETERALAGISDESLWAPAELPDGTELPRFLVLYSFVENELHHRGQLFAYLRLLGIKPPWLYGGEPPGD